MTLLSGAVLGPYEIIDKIGEGGMGEVYRARDTRLDRVVAIKVLPAHVAADRQYRDRFEREARAISRLNHPHICTIHDVGQQGDVAFMVMELVEGESLRGALRRHGRLDVERVTRIATQVAQALAAAHAAGIVHRDIKPENILVRPDGAVKVLDFGVATMAAAPVDDRHTTVATRGETLQGMIVGTTRYMAPEQARGLAVDSRADVFSFGVLLYEMLAGEPPFGGPTATDTIVSIVHEEPVPITRHRPDAGTGLARIVATCLEKEPAQRYVSGAELATRLEELERTGSASTTAPSIAVLPFVNMSADPENDFFCDGIAEDLISTLAKVNGLQVAARTSSFAFKGRQVDVKEIARVLNVRSVLDGSVRKAGNRLRVTAQLVNVDDGYQIWSERYDRQLEDVFAIQDEISLAIVEALKVKLLGEQKEALVRRQTDNIDAVQLYWRGRYDWHTWTPDGLTRARACFEQAIALDPQYALAYTGLGDCIMGWSAAGLKPYSETLPEARRVLEQAIVIDPQLSEAWNLLGIAQILSWDFAASHASITRALQLNPREAHAHSGRASAFMLEGRYEEALAPALRSVELDPLAPLWGLFLMTIEIGLGRIAEAEARATAAVAAEPRNWTAHWIRGTTRVAYRDYRAAADAFREAVPLSGRNPRVIGSLAFALARCGEIEQAQQELETLQALATERFVPQLALATAYAGLGEVTRVFAALDRSFEERDNWLRLSWWNPLFRELRGDTRMVDLQRRMGMAPTA